MLKNSIIPYKIPILVVLAGIAIICGYQMLHLPLWGHRPLFFFSAVWAFIIIAVADKIPLSVAKPKKRPF